MKLRNLRALIEQVLYEHGLIKADQFTLDVEPYVNDQVRKDIKDEIDTLLGVDSTPLESETM
jgi:hypothetical protein